MINISLHVIFIMCLNIVIVTNTIINFTS